MSKSKKFKPFLSVSKLRCGMSFIKLTVNSYGEVLVDIVKLTSDQKLVQKSFDPKNKTRIVDYKVFTEKETFTFEGNYVSDLIGIYDGKRQTSTVYVRDEKVRFKIKGLFHFSNKLLTKVNGFKNNPIEALKFLNPEIIFEYQTVAGIEYSHAHKNIDKIYKLSSY